MAYARKKNKSYELRMSWGTNPNGSQKTYSRSWRPPEGMTQKQIDIELKNQLKIFEEDIKKGRRISGASTFMEMAEFWMNNYGKTRLAPKTWERYKSLLKRVYQSKIGKMRLVEISQMDLNEFYCFLEMPGSNIHTGEALSAKTIREHHNVISKILETAWKWGLVDENVAKRADPPPVHSKETECLDEKEVSKVFKLIENEPIQYKTMITLLIMFGLRRGELCGLEWKDVDFENKRLHIRRTSQYVNKQIITKSTKTEKSNRVLTIDSYTLNLLKEYKQWQDEKIIETGKFWQDYDRLFTKVDGTPIHPDTVGDWWDKFQIKNGLKHHSLHSLRHTNASLLIACNTDVATVSGRLGHSNPNTTLKVYSHMFAARDVAAAENMAAFAFKCREAV